jgi:hypothetical protein
LPDSVSDSRDEAVVFATTSVGSRKAGPLECPPSERFSWLFASDGLNLLYVEGERAGVLEGEEKV